MKALFDRAGTFIWQNKKDVILLILLSSLLVYQLFIPPVIGVANNGDFERLMTWGGLSYQSEEHGDKYFNYVNVKFKVGEPSAGYASSAAILVKFSVWLNRLISKPGFYDIRILGFLSTLILITGFWLILVASRNWPSRSLLLVLLVLVFTDIGYTGYFNSFYIEGVSFAFLFLGIAVLVYNSCTQNTKLTSLFFFLAAFLFVTSKHQLLMFIFIFGVFGVWWASLSRKRFVSILSAIFILLAIVFTIINYQPSQINLFNSIFYGILKDSPTVGHDLQELGLSPRLSIAAGKSFYEAYPTISPQLMKEFNEKISYNKVLKFYFSHPNRFYEAMEKASDDAFSMQLDYLGNYEKSEGKKPGALSETFNWWSKFRENLLPKSLIFILSFGVVIFGTYIIRIRKTLESDFKLIGDFFIILALGGLCHMVTVIIGDGYYEINKHLFYFNLIFDLIFLTVIYASYEILYKSTNSFNNVIRIKIKEYIWRINNTDNQMLKRLEKTGCLIGLNFLILLLIESIHHGGLIHFTNWFFTHTGPAIVNLGVVFSLFFILFSLLNKVAVATAISLILLLILALLNHYKMVFLGQPIFPWDFLFYRQAMEFVPKLWATINSGKILGFAGVCLLIIILITKIPGYKMNYRWRLFGLLVSIALFFSIVGLKANVFRPLGVKYTTWAQSVNYNTNGLALAFLSNVRTSLIFSPDNYSEDGIVETISKRSVLKDNNETTKPDIIVIMSEAFWDPTQMNLDFSEDPILNIHALEKESIHGQFISPVFGGLTANSEFEFLTGFSANFLPKGAIPYMQYVNKPYPSIAKYLREKEAYETVAVHPFEKWFFDRDKVYPKLGFQRFLSITDFEQPEYKGLYISDEELVKKIIQISGETSNPKFIFAVSIQNHGPYLANRYKDVNIKIPNNTPVDSREMFTSYLQGINDADSSLKILIDHFRNSKRPTVICFFGDHLPFLGDNYSMYLKTRFISNAEQGNTEKMHTTPFIIWSNHKNFSSDVGPFEGSFLGAYLLEQSGFKPTGYYGYIQSLRKNFMQEKHLIQDIAKSTPAPNSKESDYWSIQYNFMFGKEYKKEWYFE